MLDGKIFFAFLACPIKYMLQFAIIYLYSCHTRILYYHIICDILTIGILIIH